MPIPSRAILDTNAIIDSIKKFASDKDLSALRSVEQSLPINADNAINHLALAEAFYQLGADHDGRKVLSNLDTQVLTSAQHAISITLKIVDHELAYDQQELIHDVGHLIDAKRLNRHIALHIFQRLLSSIPGHNDLSLLDKGPVSLTNEAIRLISGETVTSPPEEWSSVNIETYGPKHYGDMESINTLPFNPVRRGCAEIIRPSIHTTELHDVTLNYRRNGLSILKDSRILSGMYNDVGYLDAVLGDWGDIQETPSGSPGILAIDHYAGPNYCHWLCDGLFRVLSAIENFKFAQNTAEVIVHRKTPYIVRSLEKIGIPVTRIRELGEASRIRYSHLYVTSTSFRDLRSLSQTGSSTVLDKVRSALIPEQAKETAPEIVFISRKDAQQRRMSNEDELTDELRKLGATILIPGEASLDEQIHTIANAKLIVGAHGAGLTNIIFAPKTVTLIEISPPNFVSPDYYFLTQALGQRHISMHGGNPDPGERPKPTGYYFAHDDFSVDIPKLINFIGNMLQTT